MACRNCKHFSDFRETETDSDEVNGYCMHPAHSRPDSPHVEYGGHWTHSDSYCELWENVVTAAGEDIEADR